MIRSDINDLYGEKASKAVRLLYGGSVNNDTASAYLAIKECDGCLVGGASLNYEQFSGIVSSAYQLTHKIEND